MSNDIECGKVLYTFCDCTELQTPCGNCHYYKSVVGNNANMCDLCKSFPNEKREKILAVYIIFIQYIACAGAASTNPRLFWTLSGLIMIGITILSIIFGLLTCRIYISINFIFWYFVTNIVSFGIYMISVLLTRIINPYFAFTGREWVKGFLLFLVLCIIISFCGCLKAKWDTIKQDIINRNNIVCVVVNNENNNEGVSNECINNEGINNEINEGVNNEINNEGINNKAVNEGVNTTYNDNIYVPVEGSNDNS